MFAIIFIHTGYFHLILTSSFIKLIDLKKKYVSIFVCGDKFIILIALFAILFFRNINELNPIIQ